MAFHEFWPTMCYVSFLPDHFKICQFKQGQNNKLSLLNETKLIFLTFVSNKVFQLFVLLVQMSFFFAFFK